MFGFDPLFFFRSLLLFSLSVFLSFCQFSLSTKYLDYLTCVSLALFINYYSYLQHRRPSLDRRFSFLLVLFPFRLRLSLPLHYLEHLECLTINGEPLGSYKIRSLIRPTYRP